MLMLDFMTSQGTTGRRQRHPQPPDGCFKNPQRKPWGKAPRINGRIYPIRPFHKVCGCRLRLYPRVVHRTDPGSTSNEWLDSTSKIGYNSSDFFSAPLPCGGMFAALERFELLPQPRYRKSGLEVRISGRCGRSGLWRIPVLKAYFGFRFGFRAFASDHTRC